MSTTEPPAPEPCKRAESRRTEHNLAPVSPDPSPSGFAVGEILFGREGLRPVWGILLFLVAWQLLRTFLIPLVQGLLPSQPASRELLAPGPQLLLEGAALMAVVIATWLMSRLEARPFSSYGFGLRRECLRLFAAGAFWGAALLSLLIVGLRTLGLLVFDGRLLHGVQMLRFGLVWAAGFMLVALAEETLLRGYLQFTLTRGLSQIFGLVFRSTGARPARTDSAGFWIAALILSVVFGLGHRANPGESPLGLFAAAAVGVVFCLSLWRTGSLWWAIGFHAAWDWTQSFLYGVPDSGLLVRDGLLAAHPVGPPILSGGLTGPEGSLLLIPVLFAAAGIVLYTLPRNPGCPLAANPSSVSLD